MHGRSRPSHHAIGRAAPTDLSGGALVCLMALYLAGAQGRRTLELANLAETGGAGALAELHGAGLASLAFGVWRITQRGIVWAPRLCGELRVEMTLDEARASGIDHGRTFHVRPGSGVRAVVA